MSSARLLSPDVQWVEEPRIVQIPRWIGEYEVLERIGAGGMGVVYSCRRRGEQQRLAIKLLSGSLLQSEGERDSFLRECSVLARLQHPHILTVCDYGVTQGVPYLVTELCLDARGEPFSLAQMQDRRVSRSVDPYVLVSVVPQVCWALAYIHQQGLVHRDIKPENVLLQEARTGELTAKLADFGLAGITADAELVRRGSWAGGDEAHDGGEGHGVFSGTYDYMSPEQTAGEALNAGSDVYSLGVLVYRVATGYDRVFFRKPTEVVPDLPAWVDKLVVASVVSDREKRCRDGLELLYQLPKSLRPGGVVRAGEGRKRPERPEITYGRDHSEGES